MSNSRVTSCFGQRRRRLVHDQHARVVRQRAQDLDALAVADRERADDRRRRRDRRSPSEASSASARARHRAPVEPAERGRAAHGRERCSRRPSARETAAVPDRSSRCRRAARRRGRTKRVSTPSTRIAPAIGLNDAGHDLDQRRFAGAVLAQQRVDFARAHVERDAVAARARRERTFRCRALQQRRRGAVSLMPPRRHAARLRRRSYLDAGVAQHLRALLRARRRR